MHKSVRQTDAKNAVLLNTGYIKLRLSNWPLVFFLAVYGSWVKHTLHSSEIFFLPRSCFFRDIFLTFSVLKTYFFSTNYRSSKWIRQLVYPSWSSDKHRLMTEEKWTLNFCIGFRFRWSLIWQNDSTLIWKCYRL